MGIAPESWPSPLLALIRTYNKYVVNPLMMRLAGQKYWYASVVRHNGRRSGKLYSTPIVADQVGDSVLIPLPYGTQVDWVRNVLTAGKATIIRKGVTYEVVSPELISASQALPLLPRDRRHTFERVSIGHFLRARIA